MLYDVGLYLFVGLVYMFLFIVVYWPVILGLLMMAIGIYMVYLYAKRRSA